MITPSPSISRVIVSRASISSTVSRIPSTTLTLIKVEAFNLLDGGILDLGYIGIATAGLIWGLFLLTYFAYKESGTLETAIDKLVKEKMDLINEGFVESFKGILRSLKKQEEVLFTAEHSEQFINISNKASDLKYLRDIISDIRDEISRAFILGVICGFAALIAGLAYNVSEALSGLSGYIALFAGIFYIKYGVYQFGPMRKIEKGIRAIGKATNLDDMAKEVKKISR